MRKRTKKCVAAEETLRHLDTNTKSKAIVRRDQPASDLYQQLELKGYSWDAESGKWSKWETPPGAPQTGKLDIRLRAATGDIEFASWIVGQALNARGVKFTRMSPPDPDDRDGPAVTARVYMTCELPDRNP